MSLRTNALLQCFRKSKEEYIRKIRFYPSFLYSFLDRWLKRMSLSGWHIVHCGIVSFWFEKGQALGKEYFTYGDSPKEPERPHDTEQFDVSDQRTLDEVVRWLMENDLLPSFCSHCYCKVLSIGKAR